MKLAQKLTIAFLLVSGFTITLSTLALLLGGLELVEPYLHLPFELPIFAILLLALGSIILIRAIKK